MRVVTTEDRFLLRDGLIPALPRIRICRPAGHRSLRCGSLGS
jgi:hypothetical protein